MIDAGLQSSYEFMRPVYVVATVIEDNTDIPIRALIQLNRI